MLCFSLLRLGFSFLVPIFLPSFLHWNLSFDIDKMRTGREFLVSWKLQNHMMNARRTWLFFFLFVDHTSVNEWVNITGLIRNSEQTQEHARLRSGQKCFGFMPTWCKLKMSYVHLGRLSTLRFNTSSWLLVSSWNLVAMEGYDWHKWGCLPAQFIVWDYPLEVSRKTEVVNLLLDSIVIA